MTAEWRLTEGILNGYEDLSDAVVSSLGYAASHPRFRNISVDLINYFWLPTILNTRYFGNGYFSARTVFLPEESSVDGRSDELRNIPCGCLPASGVLLRAQASLTLELSPRHRFLYALDFRGGRVVC